MGAPWTIEPLRLATVDGYVIVPGWTNGTLCIDWRPGTADALYDMAFVVSHKLSGWAICAITADLLEVRRRADDMTLAMSWDDPRPEKLRSACQEVIAEHGGQSPRYYLMPAGLPLELAEGKAA